MNCLYHINETDGLDNVRKTESVTRLIDTVETVLQFLSLVCVGGWGGGHATNGEIWEKLITDFSK